MKIEMNPIYIYAWAAQSSARYAVMRLALFVIILFLMPFVSDAKGPAFGTVTYEPYLKEVQNLEISKLVELHKMGRIDASIQLARELWWDGDAETPINLLGTYLKFKNRDLEGSARWLKAAAAAGHPIAQETLASYYEGGRYGFPVDLERAYQLYRLAAEQGLKHSQMNVGMMLCAGKGVPRDKGEGTKWFLKANEGQKVPFSLKDGGCK
jgi:Sel1 repeat